jgi:hypothetical protein
MNRSKEEVRKFLGDFLAAAGGASDWDDFTSIPISDPELERIRTMCAEMRERFPPSGPGQYCSDEGMIAIRALLESLQN